MSGRRRNILFICGSRNQTTQMHQIARHLPAHLRTFTPYYLEPHHELIRAPGLLDWTIAGEPLRRRCLDYLCAEGLTVDLGGRRGPYDLVVTCSDLMVPRNVRGAKLVLVQEGMLDPPNPLFWAAKNLRWFPKYLAGTAATGLSHAYDLFCVASEGYRAHFLGNGCDPEKVIVTGIPNFDDCQRYYANDFPHRGYVLVCTSDARETGKRDDRRGFIEHARRVADGRPMVFKLHPNEKRDRAEQEIQAWAPGSLVYQEGSAEEMIANCDALVCQYSSVVYIGLALGKECHSYFDMDELRKLAPVQNGRAAENIAEHIQALLARDVTWSIGAGRPRAPTGSSLGHAAARVAEVG